jgi:hypothetical protein
MNPKDEQADKREPVIWLDELAAPGWPSEASLAALRRAYDAAYANLDDSVKKGQ